MAAAPVVGGRYLLSVQAGPGCGLPRGVLSFPVNVSTAGASPKPGLQATVEGEPSLLEAEFLVLDGTLRGGLGTTEKGAVANEARRVWLHTIASGPVTRSADGRGEIASGTLMGYLALGNPDDDEGALGTCDAGDHTFSLRSR